MKGLKNSVTYSSKATANDIVMFVFACVILISAIAFLALPTGFDIKNNEAGNAGFPGGEIIAGFVMAFAVVIEGIARMVIACICCGIGLMLSAKLAFKKKDIPRWLHISSVVLTVLYSISVTLQLTFLVAVIAII